jgi:putative lipoprotein
MCLLSLPLAAQQIEGTALYRERIAVPPETRFTAVLLDVSLQDVAAVELGRIEIERAGNPPYSFAIPYDPEAIDPRMTYAVRASLTLGERLLFTTDTMHPVLTREAGTRVEIVMVRVGGG